MNEVTIRPALNADTAGAYHVCLKTGNYGADGESYYKDDPDALGRIYVGPYIRFEPEFAFVAEDQLGICGYVLAALDSRLFYTRYEKEWRPVLCSHHAEPVGDPTKWTRV